MCISKAEMDVRARKIRNLKMLKKQVEDALAKFEAEVIDFLQETEGCETVNKKGVPILQYIGSDYKATYTPQERENVDKAEVKKLLDDADYAKVVNISRYSVLRIN